MPKTKPSPRPRLDPAIIEEATKLAKTYSALGGVPISWQTAIMLALRHAARWPVPSETREATPHPSSPDL